MSEESASHAAPSATSASGATPSYETARDELIEVVRRLEAGGTSLEESLELWERGEMLAAVCQNWLDGARQRLRAVVEAGGPAGLDAESDSTAPGG